MAKKQTRRSISVNGPLYDLALSTAQRLRIPLSQLTELALRKHIDGEGVPFKPTISMAFINARDRIATITGEVIRAVEVQARTAMPVHEQDDLTNRYATRFIESMARLFAEMSAGLIE